MKKTVTLLFIFICCLLYGKDLRIVSLGPTVTKQLYLLDAGKYIVGDTTYCNFQEDAKNKTKIGNLVDANIEKIVELKPDIVFATELSNENQCRQLEQLGIKVILIRNPNSFNEMCNNLIKIGEIIGNKVKAEKLVYRSKNDTSKLYDSVKSLPKVKVFVQIGSNPLFTVTQSSFINDFITLAGGENIVMTKGTGIYSREKVIEENPEVILISEMGVSSDSEKKEWEKFKSLSAVKNNRIYFIKSDELCSPNPVSFPHVLEKIIKFLHPNFKLKDSINK